MKRIIFLIFLLGGVLTAVAQERVGSISFIPRVGMNFANMTDNKLWVGDSESLNSRIKPGVSVGADVEWQALEPVSVSLGVHYSMQGSRYPDYEQTIGDVATGFSDYSTSLDYLNMPLMVNYNVAGGFSVKAGVQMGYLLKAKSKWSETVILLHEFGREQGLAVSHTDEFTDACKRSDWAIPVGVSYEFENVIIDARYVIGLSRIYQSDLLKSRNSTVQFTVGYRLPL